MSDLEPIPNDEYAAIIQWRNEQPGTTRLVRDVAMWLDPPLETMSDDGTGPQSIVASAMLGDMKGAWCRERCRVIPSLLAAYRNRQP